MKINAARSPLHESAINSIVYVEIFLTEPSFLFPRLPFRIAQDRSMGALSRPVSGCSSGTWPIISTHGFILSLTPQSWARANSLNFSDFLTATRPFGPGDSYQSRLPQLNSTSYCPNQYD